MINKNRSILSALVISSVLLAGCQAPDASEGVLKQELKRKERAEESLNESFERNQNRLEEAKENY